MTTDEKPCRRWKSRVSAFMDGELSPDREAAVSAHLSRCPACARIVREYARLSGGLETWAAAERREWAGGSIWPGVIRAIENAGAVNPPEKRRWRRFIAWPQPLWIGIAAAAVVLAVLLPLRRGPGLPSNYCRIERIAAPDRQLTIYQDRQDGFTVIWLSE